MNNLKHIQLEDVLKLESGTKYIVYNPLTKQYKEETSGKNDIAHNKHRYSGLIYYISK